jgi:cell division protein DivIC
MKRFVNMKVWMGRLKYVITLTVFGVIIIFFDQNNLIKRYKNARMISDMTKEIQQCKANYRINSVKLRMLQTNPRYIEKIAREKYLMKKPNEDVFVFEESNKE